MFHQVILTMYHTTNLEIANWPFQYGLAFETEKVTLDRIVAKNG